MNNLELIGGVLAYGCTFYSLSLVAWAVTKRVFPTGTSVGLRLVSVLCGQFVGCALAVQFLGLAGWLRAGPYLAVTLGAGAAVSWALRHEHLHRSLWRLVRDGWRLWLRGTPLGMGYVGALGLLFLAHRYFAYIRGIDSLTIHGPLVVQWIQRGRVELATLLNYPQCWEYQYAPSFLLLRSDVLVLVPSLLQIVVLLLLVREAASRLGIPGKIASLVSLLSVFNPVVWGGTMKNDPTFAIGLLLSFLALDRMARGHVGAIWLAQLGTFLILGSKATGFIYAGMLLSAFVAIWLFRRWSEGRTRPSRSGWHLAWLVAGTLALQSSAAAVQIANFVERGSPTYPIRLQVAGIEVFEGPTDLSGTSILDGASDLDTWRLLIQGSIFQLGLDFPVLLLLLLAGTLYGSARLVRDLGRGRRPDPAWWRFGILALAVCLLWILYTATPWTRGQHADLTQYLRKAESLRYAIGPICLSYIVATAFLLDRFGRQRVWNLFGSTFLALLFAKWVVRSIWDGPILLKVWQLLGALALLWGAAWAVSSLWRVSGRLPAMVRDGARFFVLASSAVLIMVSYVRWIEDDRDKRWEPSHRELWSYVRHQAPSGVVIGTNVKQPLFQYFFLGERLENEIRHVPRIFRAVGEQRTDDLDYIYVFSRSAEHRDRAMKTLQNHGWKPLVKSKDKNGILLQNPRRHAEGAIPEKAIL